MGLKVQDPKTVKQREQVAEALRSVMLVAKDNEVGPISFSDLLLAVSSRLCRLSGVDEEDYVRAAREHFREDFKLVDEDDVLKH